MRDIWGLVKLEVLPLNVKFQKNPFRSLSEARPTMDSDREFWFVRTNTKAGGGKESRGAPPAAAAVGSGCHRAGRSRGRGSVTVSVTVCV